MGRGAIVTLRYVHRYRDEAGNERWYYRRPSRKKVRLPAPNSPEFLAAYQAAAATAPEVGATRSMPGSLGDAISGYYQHALFKALAPSSQAMRRAILERFRRAHGALPLRGLTSAHVAKLLGKMRPFASRNWLKTMRGLMKFCVATGLRKDDPTAGAELAKATPGGFHTWTEDEIAQYEAHHPIGSRARLALALLLYTAARRGDVVLIGPQHIRNGRLLYRQAKTRRELSIPIHTRLQEVLAASPSGHLTFLATSSGKSFSAAGFGNLFRSWCDAAGLHDCSAHGLRKAQARRLAEAGCTAPQIASITGHKTLAEVQRYIEAAEQSRLADAAFGVEAGTRIGSVVSALPTQEPNRAKK